MSEHTPAPWYHRQEGKTSPLGDHYDWIADSPEIGKHRKIIVARDSCYCVADYAFIVKAVNNHDALVAALQALVDNVHDYERVNNLAPSPGRTECWDTVAHAKRILAAVGGESK